MPVKFSFCALVLCHHWHATAFIRPAALSNLFHVPFVGACGARRGFFCLCAEKCTSFFKKCVVGHLSASVQFRYDTDARALSGSHIVPLLSLPVQKLDLNFFRGFFIVMKRFEFFFEFIASAISLVFSLTHIKMPERAGTKHLMRMCWRAPCTFSATDWEFAVVFWLRLNS